MKSGMPGCLALRRQRTLAVLVGCLWICGCRGRGLEPATTVVMAIESSPNNLDLRVGTDAQSERVGGLLFDALVKKDAHFELQPWLAERWEQPDARTWVFHLRDGVRFVDGRPLEAEDVARVAGRRRRPAIRPGPASNG